MIDDTSNNNTSEFDSDDGSTSSNESSNLLPPAHSTNSYKSLNGSDNHERTGSILSSVFTLVSTMIGGGLLSLPFAFQQAGYGVGSFVLLFVLFASTYGGFLIIYSKKYCNGKIKNIEDVAKVAFGNKGQVIVQVLLILVLYLCSVAYYILIIDQMEPLVHLATGRTDTVWSKKIVLLSIVFVIVFPISSFKNLTALKYTSSMSSFCGLLLCGCVMYRSLTSNIGGPINKVDNPVKWYPTNVRQLLTAISIAELTFSCHFNILPMHSELRHQTRKNKRVILFLAMGVTYLMNFCVSFFGYFQFRQFTDQDITKNYASDDYVVTCGRAALCCLLILSYPLLIVPCRATLNKMIWHADTTPSKLIILISDNRVKGPNKLVWFIETILMVGTSYLLAYLIPQVNMIWGFVGSLGCTTLIYILPPAFYLRVRKHPERADAKKIGAWLLLVTGIFMFVAGLYQSVMNIVSPLKVLVPQEHIMPANTSSTSFY